MLIFIARELLCARVVYNYRTKQTILLKNNHMIEILKLTIQLADHMIRVYGHFTDEWAIYHRKEIKDNLR